MLNRRALALAAVGLWCLLFVRARTTEKSMVRAVMLERDAQGWTAGLLYQAPEAAADSSEASPQVRFAAAQGAALWLPPGADADLGFPRRLRFPSVAVGRS